MKYILDQVPIRFITLAIDSSVITRNVHQKCAIKGYNSGKRGRPSHDPIIAFSDALKMVMNGWMRTGANHSTKDAIEFLEVTFKIVALDNIGHIRGNPDLYSDLIVRYLEIEDHPVKYIFKAKETAALDQKIIQIRRWHQNNSILKNGSYKEIQYQSSRWNKPRRLVIVQLPQRKEEKGQQELFIEYEQLAHNEYMVFIPNTKDSTVEIHRRFNQHGDSENRIKELKYDYGIDGFALQHFGAMEAAFRFIIVAFNLMSIFKLANMTSEIHHRLSTLKIQCIPIGSYLKTRGRKLKMKLLSEGKQRPFLEHLFENLEVIRPAYKFSNV